MIEEYEMIIYLPTAEQYESGELVIIEHTNGKYEKSIFVSRVDVVNPVSREVGVPIPLDPHADMWKFVYGEGTNKPATYSEKAWLSKFKAGEYEKFMRVDCKKNGGIEVSGE